MINYIWSNNFETSHNLVPDYLSKILQALSRFTLLILQDNRKFAVFRNVDQTFINHLIFQQP